MENKQQCGWKEDKEEEGVSVRVLAEERMAMELKVAMALPFSAWSLANPISTRDSAAVDDIEWCGLGVVLVSVLVFVSVRRVMSKVMSQKII